MTSSDRAFKVHERMFADWPSIMLTSLPSLAAAEECAARVRSATGFSPNERIALDPLLTLGRFDLRCEPLGANGGGIEAALAPRAENRFALSVDTKPRDGWGSMTPSVRKELARHRLRFRVAHEIGHSFFYDRAGERPRRMVPNSEEQERWCDRFASALLVPPSVLARRSAIPQSLAALQGQFDVSLQVAVRAFARVHHERFVALLVARGRRPPHIRVQWQKHHGAPAARWWAGETLQRALSGARQCGAFQLAGPAGGRDAAWYALRGRQQVIVVA